MTTIAQQILESQPFSDERMETARQVALSALNKPWEGNHAVAPHPAIADAIAVEASDFAARFAFDLPVIQSAYSMLADAESVDIARRYARLPAPTCWFELPPGMTHQKAFLLQEDSNGKISFIAFLKPSGLDSVVPAVSGLLDFSLPSDECEFSPLVPGRSVEDAEALARATLRFSFALCAFLNIPGAVESRIHRWSDNLQRARLRRGKAPLLSFNNVTLALPKTSEAHNGVRRDLALGVRYHQVIGYLRISRHGDPKAYYVWVPAHWRGDASRGVVLKNRNVVLSHQMGSHCP